MMAHGCHDGTLVSMRLPQEAMDVRFREDSDIAGCRCERPGMTLNGLQDCRALL